MSEAISEPNRTPRRLARLFQNPVTVKELRGRMRGRRAFSILTAYLLVMSLFISLVYLAYASSLSPSNSADLRIAGKVVFSAVIGVQVFLVIFIGPSFTAGAISGEKERQTYDLLRTTLLSANSFVSGKLFSALSYVYLLIFASIPLISISFLLGGLSPSELIISQIIMIVSAVTFAVFGLYCSSVMRSTMAASVSTFAGALLITVGLPVIALMFAFIFGSLIFTGGVSPAIEAALLFTAVLLCATNLPATLIVSDVILVQENALFLAEIPVSGSSSAWVISPWIPFLVFYTLLAIFFYWLTVRRVRKIANS